MKNKRVSVTIFIINLIFMLTNKSYAATIILNTAGMEIWEVVVGVILTVVIGLITISLQISFVLIAIAILFKKIKMKELFENVLCIASIGFMIIMVLCWNCLFGIIGGIVFSIIYVLLIANYIYQYRTKELTKGWLITEVFGTSLVLAFVGPWVTLKIMY